MSPIKNEHTSELNLNALGLMYGHKFITFFYKIRKPWFITTIFFRFGISNGWWGWGLIRKTEEFDFGTSMSDFGILR